MRFARSPLLIVLVMIISLSSGCGGGGGGDDAEQETSDASLARLTLTGVKLDQSFQPEQSDYSGAVGFLRTSIDLHVRPADEKASIRIDGILFDPASGAVTIALAEGVNNIRILVTTIDGDSSKTYRLQITRQTAASFAQQAYIKASNTGAGDQFGHSVALSGSTLAVGAYVEAGNGTGVNSAAQGDDSEDFAGAVYVFTRDAGIWNQQAYVKASNTEAVDRFGYSVALSGDTLAVGAYGEASNGDGVNSGTEGNNQAPESGAVYVFTRSGGLWSQQAYIKASNSETNDRFGWSLALAGNDLAVGAWGEDSNGSGVGSGAQGSNAAGDSGAVYLFRRDAGSWSQQAYIKASNTGQDDYFGFDVDLSGNILAVGAWGEDSNGAGVDSGAGSNDSRPGSGAVYLFAREAGAWNQQAYIKASNSGVNDLFGYSLALSGKTLAVGAYLEASNGVGVDSGAGDNNSSSGSGAVYVFTRAAGSWGQQAYIKASTNGPGDRFGYSLALDGNTLAVAADREDSNGSGINSGAQADDTITDSGAVYVFARAGDLWSQQAYVKASNPGGDDYLGSGLALFGETLAIGASGEAGNGLGINSGDQSNDAMPGAGAVYVFE